MGVNQWSDAACARAFDFKNVLAFKTFTPKYVIALRADFPQQYKVYMVKSAFFLQIKTAFASWYSSCNVLTIEANR